jgi:hypothetical protein
MATKFDASAYARRMTELRRLGPVDYFDRYGLPRDTEDDAAIRAALETFQRYWTAAGITTTGQLFALFLEEHGKAVVALSSAAARRAYRQEADKGYRERGDHLHNSLNVRAGILRSQGAATKEQLEELRRHYGELGLDAARIEVSLRDIPVAENRTPAGPRVLDSGLEGNLRSVQKHLPVVERPDLYAFLEVESEATVEQIREAIARRRVRDRQLGHGVQSSAGSHLCGLAEALLLTLEGRRAHDDWRRQPQREELADRVRLAAKSGRISVPTFADLLRSGIQLGLSAEDAEAVICESAAKARCAVEIGVMSGPRPAFTCIFCRTEIPRGAAECPGCHRVVRIICPRCGGEGHLHQDRCVACSFAFADLDRLRDLRERFAWFEGTGQVDEALTAARSIHSLLGDAAEIRGALNRLEALQTELEALRARFLEAHRDRRLVAARALLQDAISRAPEEEVAGRVFSDWLEEVGAEIVQAERHVTRGRELERAGSRDAAVLEYLDALRRASDVEEALRGLQRCPPEPPAGPVAALVRPGVIALSWPGSASTGEILYRAIRKLGSASTSPTDGDALAETATLVLEDTGFEPGRRYVYSVFTVRGGVASRSAAASTAVLPTADAVNFRLTPGDAVVSGHWELPSPSVAGVAVTRRVGAEPRDAEDGEPVALTTLTHFTDHGLPNGERVFYRLCCEYRDGGGKVVRSSGVVLGTVPTAPPPVISELTAQRAGASFLVTWTAPPRGTVTVLRAGSPPAGTPGTLLPRSAMADLGHPLSSKGIGACEDQNPPDGVFYYLAVTTDGDLATLGASVRVANVPEVTDLALSYLGSEIRCTWTWPEACPRVIVAWRSDRSPAAPDEPGTVTAPVSAPDYRRDGRFSIRVEREFEGNCYVSVFAGAARDDGLFSGASGPNSRQAVLFGEGGRFRYAVDPVKGRWGSIRAYRLSLSSQGPLRLPDLALVRRSGKLMPKSPADGETVLRLSNVTLEPGRPYEDSIDADRLGRRPFTLSLFACDPAMLERYVIDPPLPRTLVME